MILFYVIDIYYEWYGKVTPRNFIWPLEGLQIKEKILPLANKRKSVYINANRSKRNVSPFQVEASVPRAKLRICEYETRRIKHKSRKKESKQRMKEMCNKKATVGKSFPSFRFQRSALL